MDFLDGADLLAAGTDLPVVGVIVTFLVLLLFAAAAVLFIVPAVIFLVELLLVVVIVGLGLMGRLLFRRPWTVEARQGAGQAYTWQARGWRASRALVHAVAEQLRATGVPAGGTPT